MAQFNLAGRAFETIRIKMRRNGTEEGLNRNTKQSFNVAAFIMISSCGSDPLDYRERKYRPMFDMD